MRNQVTLSKAELNERRLAVKNQAGMQARAAKESRKARMNEAVRTAMVGAGVTVPVANTRQAMIAAGLIKARA